MVKDQKIVTNAANTFNRVNQFLLDVLDPAINQYGLDLDSDLGQTAARHLVTALEHIQVATVAVLELDGEELNAHARGALVKRRSKIVSATAVCNVEGGTPVLDELNPLPEPAKAEGDDEKDATPAKAATKKASKKTGGKKAPAKATGKKKPSA